MGKSVFSAAEARKAGVSSRLLSYYAERGVAYTGAEPAWLERFLARLRQSQLPPRSRLRFISVGDGLGALG